MVALNTLLLVGLIAAGVASVATVCVLMLVGVYLGVKSLKKGAREAAEDDGGIYTIPMSSLMGGAGGGARGITQADVDQARAAMAAHRGQVPPPVDGKEEKPALGGQYL